MQCFFLLFSRKPSNTSNSYHSRASFSQNLLKQMKRWYDLRLFFDLNYSRVFLLKYHCFNRYTCWDSCSHCGYLSRLCFPLRIFVVRIALVLEIRWSVIAFFLGWIRKKNHIFWIIQGCDHKTTTSWDVISLCVFVRAFVDIH